MFVIGNFKIKSFFYTRVSGQAKTYVSRSNNFNRKVNLMVR